MSDLDLFAFEGQQVRTVLVDGEPWFVAADVTAALGLSNGRDAISRLESDGVGIADIIDSMGRNQSARILNESGLYELIFQSRVTGALAFRRWVTHEVLPAIRKTGQFGSQLPTNLADALELAAVQIREREALEARVVADAPKVAAYDQLMDSEGFYTMEAAGKLGGLGRTTFFNRLRAAGIIQSGSRMPYQRHLHLFKITTSSWTDADGVSHVSNTTRVRPDGLARVLAYAGITVEVSV